MSVEKYKISATEFIRAKRRFDKLELLKLDYTADETLVTAFGNITNKNVVLSAGMETGIKMGLLIAEERNINIR